MKDNQPSPEAEKYNRDMRRFRDYSGPSILGASDRSAPQGSLACDSAVVLLCRKCGAKTEVKRESYEPPAVATVICVCLKCDSGGFDDLQYLDAKGRDIGDIYTKRNNVHEPRK